MTANELDKLIVDVSLEAPNALEILYTETRVAVFGLAFSILKDYALAEDITHDVYIKIRTYSKKYKARGKGKAWILKITRNLTYSFLKKNQNLTIMESDLIANKELIENFDDNLALREALLALNDKQREIVVLYAVSGFTHKEIANLLNITYPTVRWHYHMALKNLKNIIERGL